MTSSLNSSRAAILAGLALGIATVAWTHVANPQSNPTDPNAQSIPQTAPPSAQPAPPGTVPITGNTPPNTAEPAATDKKDTASADTPDCVPSADKDKKDKHKKKDKKDKDDKDNPCPAGTEP